MIKIIGYDSDSVYDSKIKLKSSKSYFKEGMICCYCNDFLTINNCTREHIIPKSHGGKIIKPCCSNCNSEKANMTLFWYIKWLSSEPKTERNLRKIENAKKLFKQIKKGS